MSPGRDPRFAELDRLIAAEEQERPPRAKRARQRARGDRVRRNRRAAGAAHPGSGMEWICVAPDAYVAPSLAERLGIVPCSICGTEPQEHDDEICREEYES